MTIQLLQRSSDGDFGPHRFASGSGPIVAIDVGSSTVRITVEGAGPVEEPSVVALVDGAPVAAGRRAFAFARDRPDDVAIVHPVCGGAPADPESFTELVRFVAARAAVPADLAAVAISMPVWLGPLEWGEMLACARAVLPSDEIVTVLSSVAAAAGSQPAPPDGEPRIVLDVGHHLTEAAIVVDGDAIETRSEWTGGAEAKATLAAHLSHSHGLEPDVASLERALRLATHPMYGRVSVSGVDTHSGYARALMVPVAEVAWVLTPMFDQVADVVDDLLGAVPSAVARAAETKGVMLSGGMSTVHGLRGHVAHTLGVRVIAADAPTRCVQDGLLKTARRHAHQ